MSRTVAKTTTSKSKSQTSGSFFGGGPDRAATPFFSAAVPRLQRKCTSCEAEAARQFQPKLAVGEPDDRFEQEADRVADQVMRMPEPTVHRQLEPEDEADKVVQTKPEISQPVTSGVQAGRRGNCGGGSASGQTDSTERKYAPAVRNGRIQVIDKKGPTWFAPTIQPQFEWLVDIVTTAPVGGSHPGFVVQRIESKAEGVDCATGSPLAPNLGLTPLYWEAWTNYMSALEPDMDQGADDRWRRTFPVPSSGEWSIKGTLYFANTIPSNFQRRNPASPESVEVPSTVTDPGRNVLGRPVARRRAAGEWDSCPGHTHFHRRKA